MKVKCQGGGLGVPLLHCLLNITMNCIGMPHFPANRRCCEFGNPPLMLTYEKAISRVLFVVKIRPSVALRVGLRTSCPGPHLGPPGKQRTLRDSHAQPEYSPLCPGLLRRAAVSLCSCVSPSFPHLNPPPPTPQYKAVFEKTLNLK